MLHLNILRLTPDRLPMKEPMGKKREKNNLKAKVSNIERKTEKKNSKERKTYLKAQESEERKNTEKCRLVYG